MKLNVVNSVNESFNDINAANTESEEPYLEEDTSTDQKLESPKFNCPAPLQADGKTLLMRSWEQNNSEKRLLSKKSEFVEDALQKNGKMVILKDNNNHIRDHETNNNLTSPPIPKIKNNGRDYEVSSYDSRKLASEYVSTDSSKNNRLSNAYSEFLTNRKVGVPRQNKIKNDHEQTVNYQSNQSNTSLGFEENTRFFCYKTKPSNCK